MKIPELCRSLAVAFVLIALAACATNPIAEWHDASFSGPVDNVLIIGATEQSTARRLFEDNFVEALAAINVRATASYRLMPVDQPITREAVEDAITDQSVDAVMVTRLLGVEGVDVYRPPTYHVHHRSYYRYYSHAMELSSPGYYERYKVLTLETNLYDTVSGQLVWSMQSESFDPSTPDDVIRKQISLTIDTLDKRGLLDSAP